VTALADNALVQHLHAEEICRRYGITRRTLRRCTQ
jgi:hypothetical protein